MAKQMPKQRDTSTTLTLRDGALRIAVVSDTHGHPHPKSAEVIAAQHPDHLLHAGDIGDLQVLDRLAKIAPLSAVRGNVDSRADGVPDTLTIDVRDGDERLFTMLLLHVGVNGPRLRSDVARLARAAGARIVVCGHSHVPFIGRDGDLAIFNPGSIGPRRFQLPIVFGIIDVTQQQVAMKHVDCETGQQWLP